MQLRGQNARAFVQGFLDGFGNVGQGIEPAVDGVPIFEDAAQPVEIDLSRFKRSSLRYSAHTLPNGRFAVRGARRERRFAEK